jgi:hypothetical protein
VSERPMGVTIIAIVLAVTGVFQILVGTEALRLTSFGLSTVTEASDINGWAAIISGALSIVGAFGLFTLAGWAWLLAVAILVIRVAADLLTIVTQGVSSGLALTAITNIVISGVILWYFIRPNVRAAFGR